MDYYAVIMSGGQGKRFWPISQLSLPKQFLSLAGDGSLFTQTFKNLQQIMPASNIFTITRESYRPIILEQTPDFVSENIIVEPDQKNTAPCVALGVAHIRKKSPNSTVVILPSDHYIKDKQSFIEALKSGLEYAQSRKEIVTFGIKPDFPHTGYGYLKTGETMQILNGFEIKQGLQYVEKPNLETAEKFIENDSYYWNSGIFCAQTDVIFDLFQTCLPVIYKNIIEYEFYIDTSKERERLLEIYKRMPKISFDYGVMEYVEHLVVIPVDIGWNDVGSWASLRRLHAVEADDNLIIGSHIAIESKGTTVIGDGTIIVIGIDDIIVASNKNYVLVCSKDKEHHIQHMVDHLEISNDNNRSE